MATKSDTTAIIFLVVFIFATLVLGGMAILRYKDVYDRTDGPLIDPSTNARIAGLIQIHEDKIEKYVKEEEKVEQYRLTVNGTPGSRLKWVEKPFQPAPLPLVRANGTKEDLKVLELDEPSKTLAGLRDTVRREPVDYQVFELEDNEKLRMSNIATEDKNAYKEEKDGKAVGGRIPQFAEVYTTVKTVGEDCKTKLGAIDSEEAGVASDGLSKLRAQTEAVSKDTTAEAAKKDEPRVEWEKFNRPLDNDISSAQVAIIHMTARDPFKQTHVFDAVGEVIRVDEPVKTVTINIGSSLGVKPGFVFEVYNWVNGGNRVSKGYIEVREVFAGSAVCTINEKRGRFPVDPASGWVAPMPDALFSATSTGKDGQVQKLTGAPEQKMWVKPMEPILKGDIIHNPFFSRRPRVVTVVIDAEPAGTRNSVYKQSSIRYRKDEIEAKFREYGHKVMPALSGDCDFAVFSKVWNTPLKDSEKLAAEMGIPIIREWQLFQFMGDN
jgi:hypothetical protein